MRRPPELLEEATLREIGGDNFTQMMIEKVWGFAPWFYILGTLWRIEKLLDQHGAGNEAQVRANASDTVCLFESVYE